MEVIASGISDIGKKRKTNQDSICVNKEHHFYVVADGMGGHNGGDIASQMSVKILPEFIKKNISKVEPEKLISSAIGFVNNEIFNHGQKNAELKGMGTTISSVLITETYAFIGNVGDSRVYMINNGKLFQMTRDHSLVQEKLNLGVYDREGARNDPQKNILIKTVGFEKDVSVDVYKYKMSKHDIFIICSDGLHGKVSDSDILNIVNTKIQNPRNATQDELTDAAQHLVNQANINGGQDNISVILLAVK